MRRERRVIDIGNLVTLKALQIYSFHLREASEVTRYVLRIRGGGCCRESLAPRTEYSVPTRLVASK